MIGQFAEAALPLALLDRAQLLAPLPLVARNHVEFDRAAVDGLLFGQHVFEFLFQVRQLLLLQLAFDLVDFLLDLLLGLLQLIDGLLLLLPGLGGVLLIQLLRSGVHVLPAHFHVVLAWSGFG